MRHTFFTLSTQDISLDENSINVLDEILLFYFYKQFFFIQSISMTTSFYLCLELYFSQYVKNVGMNSTELAVEFTVERFTAIIGQ